jgi:hypothetical protein
MKKIIPKQKKTSITQEISSNNNASKKNNSKPLKTGVQRKLQNPCVKELDRSDVSGLAI